LRAYAGAAVLTAALAAASLATGGPVLLAAVALAASVGVLVTLRRSARELREPAASPERPSSGQARLVVERKGGTYADRLRAYRVLVDGQHVASVRDGEVVATPIDAGEREVELRIDWARSRRLQVKAVPGGEIRLAASPNARPWSVVFWATVGSYRYIRLKPTA
jgi:hypothetical protein